ncbi:MAG: diguanylate cyclase [Actinobacteria bacterium]|nr:MAG: diguanylate cyclase [Actinomycetota bacterium]
MGIVLALAVGAIGLALPWHRLPRVAVMIPVGSGAGLTALACWNTGGTGSPFALFYLYLAAMAAYFATRRQTGIAVAVVAVSAGLPVAYDHHVPLIDRLFEWILVSVMSGTLAFVLQQQRERIRKAAEHATALALQDPLTGVPNRRGFEQRAAAELARARRHDEPFSVLYIDLDGFKRVNDVAGHATGDALLRRVALAISVAVRGEDFVARHGGDEFAVLLPGASEAQARQVAGRIMAAVERAGADDPALRGLGASVGGASFPADGLGLEELLERADAELLAVKADRRPEAAPGTTLGVAVPDLPIVPDGDPFARLGAPSRETDEVGAWPLRRVLALGGAVAGLAVALWLLAPALGSARDVRLGVLLALVAANGAACLGAALRTRGRERVGWVRPDWRALLDLADVLISLAALAVVYLVPPVIDHAHAHHTSAAPAVAGMVLSTLALTCVFLIVSTVRPRARPDLWLVAGGFGLGAGAAVLLLLTFPGRVPAQAWGALFPVAGALVASGALLRCGNPHARATRWPRPRLPGLVVGYTLTATLLISLVVTRGAVPASVLPLVVPLLVIRYARGRLVDRENARLLDVARNQEREVAAQYRASLVALGTALEARDGYTGGHGEETLALVRRVAERLGLSEAATAEAEAVALLHDIGKIGMPDEILRKPGPLDPRERAIMRRHPAIGERILRHVPGLESVARAVRHEHERWDGTGYPDGLAGESIPLASRITLVCDAYHAMTSVRPYRAALSHDDAAEELRDCAGRQFDPGVVGALLAAMEADPPARAGSTPTYQAAW